MREEEPDDVEEWLAYHRMIGVDKVFLWEDTQVLPAALTKRFSPWMKDGFLSLDALRTNKTVQQVQAELYDRCSLPDLGGAFSWIACIDLDEFIVVLQDGAGAAKPDIKHALSAFKNNAGVALESVQFGSGGHVKRPSPGGPLRHYTKCNNYIGGTFKNIVNTYWVEAIAVHFAVYRMAQDVYNNTDADVAANPAVLANGRLVKMLQLGQEGLPYYLHSNVIPERLHGRRVRGQLWSRKDPDLGHPHTQPDTRLTGGLRMVLFHFGTRSQDDYLGRKLRISLEEWKKSGVPFGTTFLRQPLPNQKYSPEWFHKLEEEKELNQWGKLCELALKAGYAEMTDAWLQAYKGKQQRLFKSG